MKKTPRRQPKIPALAGGITIQAAHRKYGMHTSTLARWGMKGVVPVLLRTPNETYLDEAALVRVIEAYKKNPGQGKQTMRKRV